MTWNTIATLEINQDWQLAPIVAPDLGYIRLSFATAGVPVMIAQIDPVTGDLTDQRRIMATPWSQVLSFEFPSAFANRAIALRLPVPATPFKVQVELSSVPISSGDTEINLQPVLSGQTQILQAIESIDVAAIDLQPVLSGQTQILSELQSLDVEIDPQIGINISSLLTAQSNQSTVLGQIQTAQSNHTTTLGQIQTNQASLSSALASTQSAQDSVLSQILQVVQGLSSASGPVQYSLITTAYTASQSSAYGTGLAGTYATLNDNSTTTGAATNSTSADWIKATFPSAVTVRAVRVGGGNLSGWGNVSGYLNGASIQYSTDDLNWVTVATVSGVGDTLPGAFYLFPVGQAVTARFWRLLRSGFLSTTEFRFFS